MTTFKDAVRQFFPDAQFMDEPASSSDTVQTVKHIEGAYTAIVGALRRNPNQRLAALGCALWDVVHHRHVYTAMHDVPTLSFAVLRRSKGQQGVILFPPRWLDLVTKEPLMAVGSIIYTGSQVVDYYNDRISTDGAKLVQARAYSFEAEFLKTFRQQLPLSDYQKAVLRDYPQGFDAEKYGYDYRPVAPEPS